MRKISICIPTYNRYEMLFESFMEVYNDDRIGEIIISDDASDLDTFSKIMEIAEHYPKIALSRNVENMDCYRNKHKSISMATYDWCILLDSDNVIGTEYLDMVYEFEEWDDKTIYTPSFAMPHFDFSPYGGLLITKENVSQYIDKPICEVMLNACNYFVNKSEYIKVWDGSVNPVTSDSIFQSYNWLNAGNKIQVVEGLVYFHRVHSGSHYQNNVNKTPQGFHESILNKIRQLK